MLHILSVTPSVTGWHYARMRNAIAEVRERRGLSQEALAEKVNSTRQQIWRLETGKIQLTLVWVERLATAMDVDPLELLGGVSAESEQRQAKADIDRDALKFAMAKAIRSNLAQTDGYVEPEHVSGLVDEIASLYERAADITTKKAL